MAHDIEITSIAPTKALTFRKTFDVNDMVQVDYFGSLMFKAMRKAGVAPAGRPGSLNEPTDDGKMKVTFVTPVADAPDRIPMDSEDYLVEEGDALELETVPGADRAAALRVEASAETIPEHLEALASWAAEHDHRLARAYRFVIHRGPMDTMPDGRRAYPHEWIWELQQEILDV